MKKTADALFVVLFRPALWNDLTRCSWPWLLMAAALLFAGGLYWVVAKTPPDYQQGHVFKILYIHVPAAWWAVGLYGVLSLLSLLYLVSYHPVVALVSRAVAVVGLLCTVVCLLTGSLWGKPMWGTYWVWDARLVSVAVLAVLYSAYIWIWGAFLQPTRGWRMAALVGFFGSVNLPVIKWSVTWWQTLHQPATFLRVGGPAMDPSMVPGLVVMALAFAAYVLGAVCLWYQVFFQRFRAQAASVPVAWATDAGGGG